MDIETIKDIYNIEQLETVLKEKENNLYFVGGYSIFNGKIAKNKVLNQSYNFTYNKVTKLQLKNYIKDTYNLKLRIVKLDEKNILNIGQIR